MRLGFGDCNALGVIVMDFGRSLLIFGSRPQIISYPFIIRIRLCGCSCNALRLLGWRVQGFQLGPIGGGMVRGSQTSRFHVQHLVALLLNDAVEQEIFMRSSTTTLSVMGTPFAACISSGRS